VFDYVRLFYYFLLTFGNYFFIFGVIILNTLLPNEGQGFMSQMKKGILNPHLFITALFFLFHTLTFAQQQEVMRFWEDGNPRFVRVDTSIAVRVDSIVQLNFTRAKTSERDNFSLHLDGVDRIFNSTAQPLDFNPLPDRPDLYLITDAFARRVFVVRADNGDEVAEFRGPSDPANALTTPASGRAFLQAGARKLLVTDRAKHRVFNFDYDDKSTIWFYPPAGAPANDILVEPEAAVSVRALPDTSEIIICDTGNHRVLHVAVPDSAPSTYQIKWNWGQGVLNRPVDVELDLDRFLITDKGNNRILIVQPIGQDSAKITFEFPRPGTPATDSTALNAPEDAQVLSNGNILIADTGNRRLIEVDSTRKIVWSFLGELRDLHSAFRVSNRKTLVVSRDPRNPGIPQIQPIRLGYSTQTFVSQINVLAQPVDYDTLGWRVNQPIGTNVRFQIRTANSTGDLVNPDSLWLGPTGPMSYYELNNSKINTLNDGNQIFQYRVELSTKDPLQTPEITDVQLSYRFFNPNVTGVMTSEMIQDTTGRTVIAWDELQFNTIIPVNPSQRDDIQLEVRILDAQTDAVLESFQANNTSTTNLRTLTGSNALQGKQAIRLQAIFETNNASISPVLDSWRVRWRSTTSTPSAINFTNASGQGISVIRTQSPAEPRPGRTGIVFITLRDDNLIPVFELVDVTLKATASGDSERVMLRRQPTGEYTLDTGIRVFVKPDTLPNIFGNGFIEANDRDKLVVSYRDSTSLSEVDMASDTLLVLQFTTGSLFVETQLGNPIPLTSKITFKDTLFLRVKDEFDRDFSPAQDTIIAEFFDNITTDIVSVMLTELPDTQGGSTFSTGEFHSETGVPVFNSAVGIRSDRILQTRPNHEIGARYIDEDTVTVIYTVEPDTIGGGGIFIIGDGAFDFLFAPNPFRANSGQDFRLRMEAFTGDITLEKIEIYNLAGERIRTVDVGTIDMDRGISIQKESRSTSRNPWWDLRTDDNAMSSSGTYWAKFYVRFDDGIEPAGQRVLIRKFILIQ
jgi:hypothetical protein